MARQRVSIGHNTADEAQLGGSIVVTPDGRVRFTHISRDASDVASPAEILAVLTAESSPASEGNPSPTVSRRGRGQCSRCR